MHGVLSAQSPESDVNKLFASEMPRQTLNNTDYNMHGVFHEQSPESDVDMLFVSNMPRRTKYKY